jgi:hypothetical protein
MLEISIRSGVGRGRSQWVETVARRAMRGSRTMNREHRPGDDSAVHLDDPVADRQAQPGPLADRLGREERVEDFVADLRIDAAAGIGDLDLLDLGAVLDRARADDHRAAGRAGVDRVGDQVY